MRDFGRDGKNDGNNDLSARVTILSASKKGLLQQCHQTTEPVRWREVVDVFATLAPHNEARIFVLVVGLKDGRTVVIGETEPAWIEVTEALSLYLKNVPSFSEWAPKLLAAPCVIGLYPAPAA